MGCMTPRRGAAQLCVNCGYDASSPAPLNYIQPGDTLAGRYIVGQLNHKNGEGALYIGFDNSTKRTVWINEYYPHTIANRGAQTGAILPASGYGAQYKAQISDFVEICNEIKRLSATERVIPIENVISENNTVYAIYKYMDVYPFDQYLIERGGSLPYQQAVEMFTPLLGTVGAIHSRGHIHRGISPSTVYVDDQDNLYLWHFALAATRTSGCELEEELFSGYSAPEQYSPSGWQGTWTDVYAIGALLYRTLTGSEPPGHDISSKKRSLPLEDIVKGLPKNLCDAVTEAISPSADNRTQTVTTLLAQLSQSSTSNTTVYKLDRIRQPEKTQKSKGHSSRPTGRKKGVSKRSERGLSAKYIALALALTVAVLLGLIVLFMYVFYPAIVASTELDPSVSVVEEYAPEYLWEDDPIDDAILPRFVGRNVNNVLADTSYHGRIEFSVVSEYTDDWPEGTIFEQLPNEGTEIPADGLEVVLTVSRGAFVIEMIDIIGMELEIALAVLEALSGEDIEIQYQTFVRYEAGAAPNTVLSTSPAVGAAFDPRRQTLILFISPEEPEEEEPPPPPPPPPPINQPPPSIFQPPPQQSPPSIFG